MVTHWAALVGSMTKSHTGSGEAAMSMEVRTAVTSAAPYPPTMNLGRSPDAVTLGPQRRLGAIADAERLEDVGHVVLDGLLGDAEPHRDDLVGQAGADQ